MITVLTATYNRAYTLARLYESLERQTNKQFEWVVVDDGSTDNSKALLDGFQQTATFPMRVVEQRNSGKHVAINTGVALAGREWIFLVDSDDALPPDAIEMFLSDVKDSTRENSVGYCYRKADLAGNMVGNVITAPRLAEPVSPTEAAALYQGDLAYIFRREAMLKHPFPTFEGEKFVPELLIWNRLSDEGSIQYFDHKIIYLCEYLEDGYSANFAQNLRRNPRGFGVYYKHQIGREKSLTRKVKCLVRYVQCRVFGVLKGRKS
ncbi:hypothetical protein SAMN04490203_1657 [Pseudomonas taetrolens]|uniref:Glycosyltransferase 2-like domain-containing protein n=1 Tax=Pseudomonas taetrolens TaxID=47884 RepID=A0A0J6JJM7_PSETA|nr:glycosyltransferase family A protein [Pseudomonas taetrolens]KMM83997.1 hypothetical protein TU78_16150 [Pseudomonas taetrolens]SEC03073.1 hypothetical protein SAMN04490203_1657 [Pseudomonas taetrolens]SQF85820.1 family 2 glycosyl transferase [Pseudomonas taetrolens]VEH48897.1 family 2 glycosyl transferase [Pseudomonas taetrolens]